MSRPLSSRDKIAVSKAAKQLVQGGSWRQLPAGDDKTKILMALKAKLPFAIGQVPVAALVALSKAPPEGGCHWCVALVHRDLDQPELPRDEVTTAILGPGCANCQGRWEAAAVAERERAHTARLVAAGFRPEAAANLRTSDQIAEYTRMLRSLDAAQLPPRRRRNPDPPYYQRRPWPAAATR